MEVLCSWRLVAVQLVRVLEKLRARDVSQDYTYYGIASPWLQVKCLRVLQYFPPPADPAVRHSLTEMLKKIISGEDAGRSVSLHCYEHVRAHCSGRLSVGRSPSHYTSDPSGSMRHADVRH